MSEPTAKPLPPKGRILSVDPGDVRIGLAVCDPDRIIASPLETYTRRSEPLDAAYFRKLIADEQIVGFLVGLAVHLNGTEGARAAASRRMGQWLLALADLPLVYWDERYTTREAESALWQAGLSHKRRKERRDRVAAQILLQTFLDAGCPPPSIPLALSPDPESESE
ncbi:Holliday junction resolvase RuvX [Tuwongella immobilis]|uniref:Putative pre-16S rRNA nuclease n=1 Tax=Tuwongella immobilis TaxID=692036 RepID=A0A6C2YX54_9BACT|nr:Holliday junction resolvase RuvX [Tuwongella immobilis]VIP05713.1 holliday junction resolvase : Putative Holliday junction resolvase OS=Blastopirellula marina DSM 3645 GN=DSM3645_16815 PE=3 SV=1: UPF0081 [Tuwongella immobilis]VTS08782.1 holliday junction resolvase : Putative Holliday junction resolvase OS=Blastopirellula marina DSM 3645 GN=DSM3645_16815 PE=3 SV=1: UPF0081 [Tuwongella immobilis]